MKNAVVVLLLIFSVGAQAEEYSGSSFSEVWNVVNDVDFTPASADEIREFSVYAQNKLPQYPVSAQSLFAQGSAPLERDAKRTINERWDYYDRLEKRLHPNGVCVAGEWKITQPTPYGGLLASGHSGLFIGRISVAMQETVRGEDRGFGLAGKVFPTANADAIVTTANFFTVDVLLGTGLDRVLDAKTTNEPDTGFSFSLIGLGLKIGSALEKGDKNPGFRPLTQLAEADPNMSAAHPEWLRLTADKTVVRNNQSDFRNEVLQAFRENHIVKYHIEVSDNSRKHDREKDSHWKKIGEINLNKAVLSYGCDRRLHFSHPKL